jgi:hypothetical protein
MERCDETELKIDLRRNGMGTMCIWWLLVNKGVTLKGSGKFVGRVGL